MNTANTIKELRESIGMSRKEFSEHTGMGSMGGGFGGGKDERRKTFRSR